MNHCTPLLFFFFFFFFFLSLTPASPDTTTPLQPFLPTSSPPPTTIPAFPEQSDASACPLDLPDHLFTSVKAACTGKLISGQLRRSKCCPVLAAWLYSAYSATALGKTIQQQQQQQQQQQPPKQTASYYDMPILPNDSEMCVESVEGRLRRNGVELVRVNESCDVVYCECGIRLHQLGCAEAFSVGSRGELVGNPVVRRLEKVCLKHGVGGCSTCLNTLRLLNKGNTSRSEERSNKMQNEDCEMMGLTWLLAKNRSAYIHTVSAVLRAKMMNTDANGNASCTLNSDGMPLAVDSSEISSSTLFHSSLTLCFLLFMMIAVTLHQPFDCM